MESNVTRRTIFLKDNLEILRNLNSECIDLIYLDPPFNKQKKFTAPEGSSAEGASYRDIFREKDIKDEWVDSIRYENQELYSFLSGVNTFSNKYNYCYLVYMSIRLLEMHRVLKPEGSIYLHCDPTMSHFLKIALDCIFGEKNFRNEIIWSYIDTPGRPKSYFPRKHDIILFYTKDRDKWVFNGDDVKIPIKEASKERYKYTRVLGGVSTVGGDTSGKIPEDVWVIPSVKQRKTQPKTKKPSGKSKMGTGYPTQKPLPLVERIIKASSNVGDIVLDPFCGCATTCVAAEKLERKWIGIDVMPRAQKLITQRLAEEVPGSAEFFKDDPDFGVDLRVDVPKRTDTNGNLPTGNVYVISNPKFPDEYKVGIAKNVQRRLNSYQTSDPDRGYRLEHTRSTPHYKEIERHVHEKYDSKHEWVTATLDEIKDSIENYEP